VKKRFTEEQIIAVLKESEAGVAIKEICPEFEGKVLDAWACAHAMQLSFIQPDKPMLGRTLARHDAASAAKRLGRSAVAVIFTMGVVRERRTASYLKQ